MTTTLTAISGTTTLEPPASGRVSRPGVLKAVALRAQDLAVLSECGIAVAVGVPDEDELQLLRDLREGKRPRNAAGRLAMIPVQLTLKARGR